MTMYSRQLILVNWKYRNVWKLKDNWRIAKEVKIKINQKRLIVTYHLEQ